MTSIEQQFLAKFGHLPNYQSTDQQQQEPTAAQANDPNRLKRAILRRLEAQGLKPKAGTT